MVNFDGLLISSALFHAGKQGGDLIRKMNRKLNKYLNRIVIVTTRIKVLGYQHDKDQTKFEHRSNLIYNGKCPENHIKENDVAEVERQILERITDHNKRYTNSHLLEHAHKKKSTNIWVKDYSISNSTYSSNVKTKISRSLYLRSKIDLKCKRDFSEIKMNDTLHPFIIFEPLK